MMLWQIGIIGLVLFGCLFIVWRLVSSSKNLQKEADQQRSRADTAEGTVRSMVDSKGAEADAERAAAEARKNVSNKPWLLLALACSLAFCGCSKPKQPAGTWPVYKLPPPLTFSPEETVVLAQFASEHPKIFEKIKADHDGCKAILLTHNKNAKEVNRKRLKELGLTEDELKAWLGSEE